ncbi:MAG TPA: VacJ family lipoprotein, partial [Burkholderiales bacterium]|nr:VacJ family lipoprotein [Burkholderiales bacterium]
MKLWKALLPLAIAVLAGCATGGDSDPRDPLEPLNRAVYRFNDRVDEVIAKPVATVYRDLVPEPLRNYVRNFFGNISDLFIGFNNILQGKPDEGLQDWVRFAFNSTLGIFGINDVASDMGLEKHNEDFGQTFGRWGFPEGPYLVLPLLGSSDVRDGIGTALDLHYDPTADFRPI